MIVFYNKGVYAHNFIFETTTQITDGDIYKPTGDVAFREIDLTMNVIVGDMEMDPTDPMTITNIALTNGEDVDTNEQYVEPTGITSTVSFGNAEINNV